MVKSILVLVLCANLLTSLLCLSEELQELIDMLHATCVDETGVAEELIVNARKGDFADNEALKCYIKCVFAQMACIDDEGIIDEDAAIAVLPEEYRDLAAPIIRKCGTKVGSNPCENVWLTNKCYYEQDPVNYFLV